MIILFGPAGSGKSVQGKILAQKYGWEWMSVGQLLRDKQSADLEEKMLQGGLVDDRIVVNMMHDHMMDLIYAGKEAVLDGYPRDEWQAEWMIKYEDTKYVKVAIILDVPHQELWKRLEARGRADDKPEAIEKRWGIFEQTIYTMTQQLESQGVPVVRVDGTGEIPQITERIEQILRERAII